MNRITRYAALPLIALATVGTAVGAVGAATAGTLPTDGPTIAMTIRNNSNETMFLQGSSNPYGEWIQAPRGVLAPHSTEIVTAHSRNHDGFGVDATYSVRGDATAVFSAYDYSYNGGTNTEGTRTTGNDGRGFDISSWIDSSYPTMNVSYTLNPIMGAH
jgi:hypothetical protein